MNLEVYDSFAACSHLKERWNSFADQCGNDISLTFEWHQALAASHPLGGQIRALFVYDDDGLQAILPLVKTRRLHRWIPLQHVSPLGATYCAHDCLLLRSTSLRSLEMALDAVAPLIGPWDVLSFGISESTHLFSELEGKPSSHAHWITTKEGKSSPYLVLDGTFDDFSAKLGAKMRSNIKAVLKRFQGAGAVELVKITSPSDIAAAFDAIKKIELNSWKQRAGTSITANPPQLKFYETLMHGLAANGSLLVFLLLLDGKPIAHDLGFVYKNRYFCGKSSFIDEFRHLQPGFLLRWFILQDLYQSGVLEHDFMGDSEPHKLKWTSTVRRHRNVLLYRKGALSGISLLLGRLGKLRRNQQPSEQKEDLAMYP